MIKSDRQKKIVGNPPNLLTTIQITRFVKKNMEV